MFIFIDAVVLAPTIEKNKSTSKNPIPTGESIVETSGELMFISFYITDSKYSLVFQYLLGSNSPPFAHLWSKAQVVCPEMQADGGALGSIEDTKVRDVNGNLSSVYGSVGKNLELYKYYSSTNKLYYFCLTSGSSSTSNMAPFIFLEDMDKTLVEYFEKDQITVSKIRNNYDRITMIFYICVDGGEPAAGRLYGNIIKRVIPKRSDLSKIINSTAHTIQVAVQRQQQQRGQTFVDTQQKFPSENATQENEVVPWRSGNLKYTNNEIYVDMTETIHVIYQKATSRKSTSKQRQGSSKVEMICGTINGTTDVKCYLSDNPLVDLQLDLAGNDLGVPAFHDCVETDGFNHKLDSNLKFVPPDGKFSLMQYSIDLDMPQMKQNHHGYNNNVGLITVDFNDQLGNKKDEFEITVNISNSTQAANIENLRIEVDLHPLVATPTSTFTSDSTINGKPEEKASDRETDFKIKVLRNTHGRFDNSVFAGKGTWIFDKETPTGTLPVLRGCVEFPNNSSPSQTAKVQRVAVSYSHTGQLPSGIRVKSILVGSGIQNKNNLKLFKGVKYITRTGDFEIRS